MKISDLKKQLIVSCQAVDNEPLNHPLIVSQMAYACVLGGAKILRMSQAAHIKAAKNIITIPIIGLIKAHYQDSEVYITPTLKEVKTLLELKVEVIAIDATIRTRPKGENLVNLITYIRKNSPNTLIMADCSDLDDVRQANELDFDLISTTLRGYTLKTKGLKNSDNEFEFIKLCLQMTNKPIVAEGGIWEPQEADFLLNKLNVFAVVVGSAITRPEAIVRRWHKKIFWKDDKKWK